MSDADAPNGPVVVAIETSTQSASLAVGRGNRIVSGADLPAERRHAADLLPTLDEACRGAGLAPADIRRVYVSRGPGSFTGLRIGITVARMIAFANGAGVIGVATMRVIARRALSLDDDDRPDELTVLLPAGRGNLYAADFRFIDGDYVAATEPRELSPEAVLASASPTSVFTGQGAEQFAESLDPQHRKTLDLGLHAPTAAGVFELGCLLHEQGYADDPRLLTPTYVRKPAAEEVWEQRGRA